MGAKGKVTNEIFNKVKKDLKDPKVSQKKLADKYNISPATVCRINRADTLEEVFALASGRSKDIEELDKLIDSMSRMKDADYTMDNIYLALRAIMDDMYVMRRIMFAAFAASVVALVVTLIK